MPIDRYLFIDSIIHFSHDDEKDEGDKMWKLQTIMNLLNKSFGESFDIGQDISIDESLLLWRGHHSIVHSVVNIYAWLMDGIVSKLEFKERTSSPVADHNLDRTTASGDPSESAVVHLRKYQEEIVSRRMLEDLEAPCRLAA
jgi:hypothetical protein